MQFFRKLLEFTRRFFDTSDEIQAELSASWRPHANRRTLVAILGIGAIAIGLYLFVIRPPDAFPLNQLVSIDDGSSLQEVSVTLEKDHVVRSALAFRMLMTLLGHERSVHAGDYIFKEPIDLFSVVRSIATGAFGLEPEKIRIPEGATTREMATIFASRLERFNAANFLAQAQPMEGYLFPDTYFFLPNATEDTVIKAMRQNFDEHEKSFDADVKASGHSLEEIITMASILEREARTTDDRRMISGVLWNRIARGMPLQVDATFLYTIGKGSFQLTIADLKSDSPYNTYTHKGLPPGPIGSPSLDSIEAALHPTKSDYLYYLADNNGVTHYSKTYEEHLEKKRRYLGT